MNICLLMGNVETDVKFDFMVNSNKYSIARFKIKLSNDSVVNIIAYNEYADYCYQNLNKGNIITIAGKLDSNLNVILTYIYYVGNEQCSKMEKGG